MSFRRVNLLYISLIILNRIIFYISVRMYGVNCLYGQFWLDKTVNHISDTHCIYIILGCSSELNTLQWWPSHPQTYSSSKNPIPIPPNLGLTYSLTMLRKHFLTESVFSPEALSSCRRVFTSQMGLVSEDAVKPAMPAANTCTSGVSRLRLGSDELTYFLAVE